MSGKILRYFTCGNTAKGFYNLFDSNLAGLEHVFILSGKSKREKSEIIEQLIQTWSQKNPHLEIIQSALHEKYYDGFIIRSIGFAIVDGDAPCAIGSNYVGSNWETIDLEGTIQAPHLESKAAEIIELKEQIDNAFKKAFEAYEAGLNVHDDWEKIYINQMDFNKADHVTDSLIDTLFKNSSNKEKKEPQIFHRFLGAATPTGPIDFVPNITDGLTARYFLKGRAGTGKSTLLKKIVARVKQEGYDMEIYHCGFDPESLDMVLVRELGWAVFDSTKPHEYFPELKGDTVIDMYELTVAPETDEAFADEIKKIEAKYRFNMEGGKKYLAEAKYLHEKLEEIYSEGSAEDQINEIVNEVNEEIQLLIDKVF